MNRFTDKVIGNTFWLLSQKIVGRGLSLLLTIYLARELGSLNFGKLTFAISFGSIFLIFSDMGLTTLTVREVARYRDKGSEYIGKTLPLKIFISILAFLMVYISSVIVKLSPDIKIIVYLIAAYLILQNIGAFFGAIFQAYENMRYMMISGIIQRVFLLFGCLILLYIGYGIISVCFWYLLSSIFYCLLSINFTYSRFLQPRYQINIRFWKESLKKSLPLALIFIISMLYYHTDIIMLGKMKGQEVVGWYGVSYRIFFTLATLAGAFLGAIFPVMSRVFKQSPKLLNKTYQKSIKLMVGIGIPLSILTYLLSEKIIFFLFGPEYICSISILRIFSLLLTFSYLNGLAGYFLTSTNRQMLTVKILAITTSINIFLNFIFIPHYSYIGAAYATVVSEILFYSIFYFSVPEKIPSIPLREIGKLIISCLVMVVLVVVLKQRALNLLLILGSGLVVYFYCIWVTGYISAEEKVKLKNIFMTAKTK